ncbi:MAG: hypothetical protein PHI28_06140 [Mangrovibacterium sp.]|nr:hypothetical protein [Mangrovibacterium sp.]
MKILIDILLLGGFSWIAWQDFKCRKVYLLSFLPVFVLLAIKFIFHQSPSADLIWLNLAVMATLATGLVFYYTFRYGRGFAGVLAQSVGLGDLLLIPVLLTGFSTGNFILLLIISFVVAFSYGIVSKMSGKKETTIPLAGIQSLLLSIALILEYVGLLDPWNDLTPLLWEDPISTGIIFP